MPSCRQAPGDRPSLIEPPGVDVRPARVTLCSMPATSYRYLTTAPGVRSGRTIIEGTRIGVHDVVGLFVHSGSVDEVCRSFPGVTRAQVYECLAFYEDHRAEIDDLVASQMHDPKV